jgi:hypothetical protein
VSEFDNLKTDAEQYPQQIREGEDAAEKKFGIGQQDLRDAQNTHRDCRSHAREWDEPGKRPD